MYNHNARLLLFFNIVGDYILLVLAFLAAGLAGAVFSTGSLPPVVGIRPLLPLAFLYAVIPVVCYGAVGSYAFPQLRSKGRAFLRLLATDLAAFALAALLSAVCRFAQVPFSLLVAFYGISAPLIFAKRWLVDKIVQKQPVPAATCPEACPQDSPHLVDTCPIMGVNIGVTDMDKTMALLEKQLTAWRGSYICVANVHTTVTAYENPDYLRVQNGAVLILPDGGPLSAFSRGQGFAGAQRVTGPDLMRRVLAVSAEKGWRHYFYGSTEETLAKLRAKMEERYPGAVIAGMYSPPFRALTPQEDAAIVEKINAAQPDFVWVGLGAPKQERWMAAHENRVQALMLGVGAAFDYEADNIKRAPGWMQRHNLEWLYRLLQDPRRLLARYCATNLKFLWWKWQQ